jgi:hypothetical protein
MSPESSVLGRRASRWEGEAGGEAPRHRLTANVTFAVILPGTSPMAEEPTRKLPRSAPQILHRADF